MTSNYMTRKWKGRRGTKARYDLDYSHVSVPFARYWCMLAFCQTLL